MKKPQKSILECRKFPIEYTDKQKQALLEIAELIDAKKLDYYLLQGYAGSGKTTAAENIIRYGVIQKWVPLVLAPTNKAAKVLREKFKAAELDTECKTIHSALYGAPNEETGEWDLKEDFQGKLVLVDEASLLDQHLMDDLIMAMREKSLMILMGDSFQLEPVGDDPGLFVGGVREIQKKIELDEVRRQALESTVLKVATYIRTYNEAVVPKEYYEDFQVVPARELGRLYVDSVVRGDDSIAIVATNKERIEINNKSRWAKYNGTGRYMEPGERLMAIANSERLSNSETFVVTGWEPVTRFQLNLGTNEAPNIHEVCKGKVKINGGDKLYPLLLIPTWEKASLYHPMIEKALTPDQWGLFDSDEIDEKDESATDAWVQDEFGTYKFNKSRFMKNKKNGKTFKRLSKAIIIATYGYAVTAHKSQGSQWKDVYVNQSFCPKTWNPARWFYTAITRAEEKVICASSRLHKKVSLD